MAQDTCYGVSYSCDNWNTVAAWCWAVGYGYFQWIGVEPHVPCPRALFTIDLASQAVP